MGIRSRIRRGLRVVVVLIAWTWCYVLSAGPVLSLVRLFDAPDDVRMAISLTVYWPLTWLSVHSGQVCLGLLEWYFRAWRAA